MLDYITGYIELLRFKWKDHALSVTDIGSGVIWYVALEMFAL